MSAALPEDDARLASRRHAELLFISTCHESRLCTLFRRRADPLQHRNRKCASVADLLSTRTFHALFRSLIPYLLATYSYRFARLAFSTLSLRHAVRESSFIRSPHIFLCGRSFPVSLAILLRVALFSENETKRQTMQSCVSNQSNATRSTSTHSALSASAV